MKSTLKEIILLMIILIMGSCLPEPASSPSVDLIHGPHDEFPAWSPDGEQIAYYHFSWDIPEPEEYPTGLYIIDKDGHNRRLILRGAHFSPAWSPDGEWLVFSSSGVIQKCKIDGDSLTTFNGLDYLHAPEFYFPHWSNDGKFILVDKPFVPMGIYCITADFKNADSVISVARDPESSPNGDEIIYFDWVSNTEPSDIFKSDINGLHKQQLTNNDRSDMGPTWSPDGKRIAWSSNTRLCVMNADGSNQKQIEYGNYPSWSVNNELVYSYANADYTKEVLYIVDPNGKNKRQITY
ncbi:MAG: hypothetical protein RBS33_13800 [Lentimicrobium sp.]|jgi:Tol biopolymer transport system component|nr:hypothetical protein [Lentimicrobiaceae bacterium]MDD2528588.1 hypothetical protein [Lentimicrobiaceae bacterium]MDY0027058.1 hypothetical protein [Lentimicrobium sp.]